MSAYVTFFDDKCDPRLELLGGKCASLVALTAAGLSVPPGFAVTTASFETFLDRAGIRTRIAALLDRLDTTDVRKVDAASAEIRAAIEETPVPDDVREAFDTAYERLQSRFPQPVPVAVRSSATAEDLPDASFAGQQDTYLWLLGRDEVAEHVRRCWASLYTSRAITYRMQNHIPDEGLSMAVAVQKMVNARSAGVAMTIDPATGDRAVISIDSSWGLGELVVSGLVTPDHVKVDKVMLSVVAQTVGDKHVELVPDTDGRRVIEVPVDDARRAETSLTHEEIVAVATIAKRAEKHFGSPQDIEWAIDRELPDGENLMLLQSRPETVWSHKTNGNDTAPAGAGIESIARALMAQVGR
ncbi:PEP/pyruvate-binding domain-containing protein [Pseudolysinimonas sp.]